MTTSTTPTARILTKKASDESGTRERILSAAAPLFAEGGFDATGVRAIAAAAQVNIAAVNYHFGSKDALIAAVGERHVRTVGELRLNALEVVLRDAPGGVPTVRAIMEAFIGPPVRFIRRDPSTFQLMRLLLGRMRSDRENTCKLMREAIAPVLEKFADALALAIPGAERAQLHRALHLSVGSLLHEMSCPEMLGRLIPGTPDDLESLIARVVDFTTAGVNKLAKA